LPYSKNTGYLIAGKALLLVAWLAATGFYLWRYDLATTGALGFPYVLMILTMLTLGLAEILLGYAKWGLYHAALQRFYSELPQFIQDAFHPPASLYEAENAEETTPPPPAGTPQEAAPSS
jgi:hypothetical protein